MDASSPRGARLRRRAHISVSPSSLHTFTCSKCSFNIVWLFGLIRADVSSTGTVTVTISRREKRRSHHCPVDHSNKSTADVRESKLPVIINASPMRRTAHSYCNRQLWSTTTYLTLLSLIIQNMQVTNTHKHTYTHMHKQTNTNSLSLSLSSSHL